MSNWDNISAQLNKKTEQSIRQSLEKSEVKHVISMAELESSAREIDVDAVHEGRSILDQLRRTKV